MKRLRFSFLLSILILPYSLQAAFSNYNSILIGEKAAGMGGAFTALSGDASASSFYNPATLARMEGSSLSASVSIYNKYETNFGDLDDYNTAPLRVNRGAIVPIPASGGSVYTFGNVAFALSIVFPDYQSYTGEVRSTDQNTSFLNLRDQSLWVGGSLGLNLSEQTSAGFTMYYTSRSFSRSVLDQSVSGGNTRVLSEEKIFTQNSIVYVAGLYHELNRNWHLGVSTRLPSIPIDGNGSYYLSEVESGSSTVTTINRANLRANTEIPTKTTLGLAYEQPGMWSMSFDASYYGATDYSDLEIDIGADQIEHKPIWNFSLGGEYYWKPWLAWRAGFFTNFSSHPAIDEKNPSAHQGDYVDMMGFSTNVAIYTSLNSVITLGGYYTGGKGESTQRIGGQIARVPKSEQLFSFLVGTSFKF